MTFGQKRHDLSSVSYEQAAMPSPVAIEEDHDEGDRVPLPIVVAGIVGALFCALLIDIALSGTALITPINHSWLSGMRLAGVAIGAGGALWLNYHAFYTMVWRFKFAMVLLMVAFGFLAFNAVAYRLVEMREFGFSSAPFEQAIYPIKMVSHGRKGARDTLEIDPFNIKDATNIPIPAEQYDELDIDGDGRCVVVEQRRSASGAIEVRTDGSYTLSPPKPVVITDCPAPR